MTTDRPAPARCRQALLLAACAFAPAALVSCACDACKGHGYVLAQACSSGSPALGLPKESRILPCLECDATGNAWGIGFGKEKKDAQADELNVIRIY